MKSSANTGGALVYVIGDVHGCYELLLALVHRIAHDSSKRALGRRPVLVFCGDYVDRGTESARVIEAVLQLQRRPDFDVRLLKGNHEQAMLDFLRDPAGAQSWLSFGGLETLASYGVRLRGPLSNESLTVARNQLLERIPAAHLNLLHQLELMLIIGDYAIVHAGVRPKIDLKVQSEEDLLWIRDEFIDAPYAFEKVIVHGHTWTSAEPFLGRYRIGIDTGAYETGVLTAVRLDRHDINFLQVSL